MAKSHLVKGNIFVQKSLIHGYGVFADQDFKTGDIIEECHCLFFKEEEAPDCIMPFAFVGREGGSFIIPFGYGCIYNHWAQSNAKYYFDAESLLMTYKAIQDIKKGEEITISYGKNWFSEREWRQKTPTLWFYLKKVVSPSHSIIARFFLVFGACLAVQVVLRFLPLFT